MWNRGLVIREPWIGKIVAGTKIWEMRSKPTRTRGPLALIRAGSGLVVGTAELVDSLPPLTEADYFSHIDKHAIPETMRTAVFASGWVYPWVLADVRSLPAPVPYHHRSGAVTFVRLDGEVDRKIAEQMDSPGVALPHQGDSGHPLTRRAFKPVEMRERDEEAPFLAPTLADDNNAPVFVFRPEKAQAYGRPLSGGKFLVLAGSTAMKNGSPRIKRDQYEKDALVRSGVLVSDADPHILRFSRDHTFGSASQAAGVVKDGNASGPSLWKDETTGLTLRDFLSLPAS